MKKQARISGGGLFVIFKMVFSLWGKKIQLGDRNGNLGMGSESTEKVIESFGVQRMNDNGAVFLSISLEKLWFLSTKFKLKTVHGKGLDINPFL